ncbi:MAG: restriction endonuclease subunit S [Rhodoferax sp.]|nr:restriction endonuclease subunit S [Rhodoferax sp.]
MSAATQWPLRRLGDICEFKYGKSLPESARSGGEVPVYGSNGVVGGHDVTLTASETIVIGRKGSHGEVNFSDKPCWPIDTTYYVDSTTTEANLHWLKYRLAGAGLNQMNRAAAVPGLNREDAYRVEVLLPPLEEQRRIAAILDQAETLRTQRRTALTQLDSLTQSLFLDMFGDAEVKGWPIETIAAVAHPDKGSMRTGPFGSQLLHSEFVAEGVSVLGIDNAVTNEFRWGERRFISEAKYRDLKRYTVKPGDVLITIMGTCGRCAVVPDDIPLAINTKHICCITLDKQKCMPEFLHVYFLRHPMARKYLAQTEKGAIMAGLNMGLIQAMPIPVPPLVLQQTFATRIQAIEALKATHRAALAELDALFASLQQRAFSGELTRPASAAAVPRTTPDLSAMCTLDVKKMLEALIYVAKRMPEHDFYKSLKALYSGDRQHLENHGSLIYGETYEALKYGPVPKAAYAFAKASVAGASSDLFAGETTSPPLRLTDNDQLIPARDADFGLLSAAERKSLDWAIKYYGPMSFGETKTVSHDSAYLATALNAPMAIEDIIRSLPEVSQQRFFN